MDIQHALARLDPELDAHWTADGMPLVAVVADLVDDGSDVNREAITEVAPTFNRDAAREAVAKRDAERETANAEKEAADLAAKDAPMQEGVIEFDPAYVEPEDDVVAMDIRTVYQNLELTDRAIAEFARQAAILAQRRDAVMEQIKDVGRRSELLENQRNRLLRGKNTDRSRDQVQAYLAGQKKAREARGRRAQAFIDAGTTEADVAKQMSVGGASQLDRAMSARKPTPGSTRPSHPQRQTAP